MSDRKVQLRVSNHKAYVWDVDGELNTHYFYVYLSSYIEGQISRSYVPNTTSAVFSLACCPIYRSKMSSLAYH